jgi:oxygen-independent coproporphyrinogen III oxidase
MSDVVEWPSPRAAYVHIPFCRHRCGYCNFSVLSGHDDYADEFLIALERELSFLEYPRQVDTIFIGGGTPTHLAGSWIERMLGLVKKWFVLNQGGEFSVEGNPSDIHENKLRVLADGGINRISLGVQSFDEKKLAHLERDHDLAIARQAAYLASEAIGNVSIDLIFAAPDESLAGWASDLQQAFALPIQHLSTYGLTFEKGTRFWNEKTRGNLIPAEEDLELAMYKLGIARARDAGWNHYEVSNFSKPGFECRHNKAYWEGRGWFAAGPSAASFVDGFRSVNHRSPTTYMRRLAAGVSPIAESERIDRETWARERLVFGLRMIDGVDLEQIERETQFDLQQVCGNVIDRLVSDGLLEQRAKKLRLSERGLYVSDSVLGELLG